MMYQLKELTKIKSKLWWFAVSFLLFLVSQYTMGWLNELYEETMFPVSFMEGQLAFYAVKIKSWYGFLEEQGTMNKYLEVQIFDYSFMVTVFLSHLSFALFVYKCFADLSRAESNVIQPGMSVAWLMVFISPLAAIFDALENAVSFVMLADPVGFSDWLVFPYSALAALKFLVFTVTWCWLFVGLIWVLYLYIKQSFFK